ncbi:DUF6585 family protein [Nocardia sp. NPDC127526]|uniref:DUF6585 family protein n=1 Tax=Nocardia sp. NPDC127526 TaxID=3345393 RepID=UPI0036254D49
MAADGAFEWTEIEAAPEGVRRAAAKHGLGSRFVKYRTTVGRGLATVLKLVGTGLVAALFGGIALHAFGDDSPVIGLLTGAVAAASLYTMIPMVRSLVKFRDEIYLLDAGLVQLSGRRARVFPWSTVEAYSDVTRWVKGGTTQSIDYKFTVRTPDGAAVVLDNHTTWDIDKLGAHIQGAVAQHQLPLTAARVEGGETVTFGRFGVNRQGITDAGRLVPWSEVDAIHHAAGQIGFRRRGVRKPITVLTSKIPNGQVFAALAQTTLLASRGR